MKSLYSLFIIFILFTSVIKADNLLVHKKIVPISLLQINDIANKKNKVISLTIVVKDSQMLKALKLKKLLPKTIKSFVLSVTIVKEKDIRYYSLKNQGIVDAFYCFDLSKKSYKFLKYFTINNNIPTFSNTIDGLKKGNLIFIDIKNKIHILINRKVLKDTKISFNNQFMQIVEIYDK